MRVSKWRQNVFFWVKKEQFSSLTVYGLPQFTFVSTYLVHIYGKCGTIRKPVPTGSTHVFVPGLASSGQQANLLHLRHLYLNEEMRVTTMKICDMSIALSNQIKYTNVGLRKQTLKLVVSSILKSPRARVNSSTGINPCFWLCPVLIYISLLIISCIIEYVTNKRTLNLDSVALSEITHLFTHSLYIVHDSWVH